MKNVPHWQSLVLVYVFLVAIPVYTLHRYLQKKLLANKTLTGLFLYTVFMVILTIIMHTLAMWVYYRFLFNR
jgi:uncharacterized BrkB/YihY/UPF0761 family membrane protein